MHVKIEVKELKNLLIKIFSIVDKKNSRPILTSILVKAFENKFILAASNMEVSAKLITQADVEKEGSFCVNAKNIFDIVKELPDKTVELNIIDNLLHIACDKIKYSLLVISSNEFPRIEFNTNENPILINTDKFNTLINKTSYAISDDDTRLFLNGTFLQLIDSKIRAVATDGYKLALLDTEIYSENSSSLINGIIIPKKGIFELKKMCESLPDTDIKVTIDESFLFANINDEYFLAVRLISRDYPSYQNIIPTKTINSLTVDKNSFLKAVKRIKVMSDERSHTIKLTLNEDSIKMTAINPVMGEASEKLDAIYSAKELSIGFNAKFLIDTLNSLDDGNVIFEFNNELSPVIVKSNLDSNFLGIVMPLKLTF